MSLAEMVTGEPQGGEGACCCSKASDGTTLTGGGWNIGNVFPSLPEEPAGLRFRWTCLVVLRPQGHSRAGRTVAVGMNPACPTPGFPQEWAGQEREPALSGEQCVCLPLAARGLCFLPPVIVTICFPASCLLTFTCFKTEMSQIGS